MTFWQRGWCLGHFVFHTATGDCRCPTWYWRASILDAWTGEPLACMDDGCAQVRRFMRRPGKEEATGVVVLTKRYILRSSPAGEKRGHRSCRSDNALHTPVCALNHVICHRRFLALSGQQFWTTTRRLYLIFFFFTFSLLLRCDWSSTRWSHIYRRSSCGRNIWFSYHVT